MMIETIIFDFGGVIIKTPNLDWLQRWRERLGLKPDQEIAQILSYPMESELIREIFLGTKSEETLWHLFAERLHLKLRTVKRIRRHVFSTYRINKPIVRILKELKSAYKTAILSNASDQTRKLMESKFQLHEIVDDIIISAEEGLIKPDPQIYQLAMDRLDASPETTLFLDDLEENVRAAKEFGMKAIQFLNTSQAIHAVRDILKRTE